MSIPHGAEHGPPKDTSKSVDPVNTWLRSTYLGAEDGGSESVLVVQDFINYIRSTTPDPAYFTTEMIDWALEAVRIRRNINETSDTYIASVSLCQLLFSISPGPKDDPSPQYAQCQAIDPEELDDIPATSNTKTTQEEFFIHYKAMQGKRFIFLPVNNGFDHNKSPLKQCKATHGAKKQGYSVQEDDSTTDASSPGYEMARAGSHWSFIVVDTSNRTARYIDSLLRVTSSGKKHMIQDTNWNAPIAGRVLAGFDIFMKRKKGEFDARTLKWVPHQDYNNESRNDVGACGPYIYALMDYINEQRNATLLSRDGLEGFFTLRNKGVNCEQKINFDSNVARSRIQAQLETLRVSKEENAGGGGNALYPANLDPATLPSVLNPKVLRQIASGPFLRTLVDIHFPPKPISDNDWIDDEKVAEGLEAFWNKHGSRKRPSGADADHEYLIDRAKLWSLYFPNLGFEDAMHHIDAICPNDPVSDKEWQERQDHAIRLELVSEEMSNNDFRVTVWDERADLRKSYAKYIASIRGLPKRHYKRNRLTIPEGISDLPFDFANETEVPSATLGRWKSANRDLLETIFVDTTRPWNALTYRAALQASSGQKFMDESQARIEKIWAKDTYAIDQAMEWPWKEMQLYLRRAYEDAVGLPDLPDLDDDDSDDDTGDGDKTGSDRNSKSDNGLDHGLGGGDPKVDQGKLKNTAKNNGVESRYRGPHSRHNWLRGYPDGFSKDNLPDFATLSVEEAMPWREYYKKDLFDFPKEDPGISTILSVLHRTYKGTFCTETFASLSKYLSDDIAFPKHEKHSEWTVESLAARLDETYVTLNVPYFALLSNEELREWLAKLPRKQVSLVTRRAPDRGQENTIFYNRARGLLHRMFVGEFDEMSSEDIADWRQADPYITGSSKSDNESAMIIMKILYDSEDVQELPWLKRSPLHWPSREHRTLRVNKRKRDDDDTNDDDGTTNNKRPKSSHNGPDNTPKPGKSPGLVEHITTTDGYEPVGSPEHTDDPGNIVWSMITDVDLKKHLTKEVKKDTRIGQQGNQYSYRAVLFVTNGGTFKDESEKDRVDLWIRDTNVFRHGLAFKGDELDLALQDDGSLIIRPPPEEILKRMATKYESEGLSGDKTTISDTKAASHGPSRDEEAGTGIGGTEAEEPEGLYEHTPDFGRAPKGFIEAWVEINPEPDLKKKGVGLWLVRRVLQKHFGGFDGLSDDAIEYWWKRDDKLFSDERKTTSFDRRRIVDVLKQPVPKPGLDSHGNTQYFSKRDLHGHKEYYPQKYIDYYAATHMVKSAEKPAT